jgi:uncharacterized membrane protein YphA (DoxX/SURF4 family)
MNLTTETLEERVAAAGLPRWKVITGHFCAILLCLLFLASGLWKLLDPLSASERMVQSLVPASLSLPAAAIVGIGETFAALLLLFPRFRRWGALLAGLMLIVFTLYVGLNYEQLLGDDCNCFPWIRRIVSPLFFVGDFVMLILAVLAGWWSKKPQGMRAAALLLAPVMALAFVCLGVAEYGQAGIRAPETILVEGQPHSLQSGRILLFFFDPECSHCDSVARAMARQSWTGGAIIAVPTAQPQFARDFLKDTGINARISSDADLLRETFKFNDSPYAVALVDGEQKAAFNSGELEDAGTFKTLLGLGFIR